MKKIAFFLFAAMLVTFFACRKDVDEVTTDETTYVPPILEQWVQPIRNVNGTLIVFVSNEAGEPVPDAKVKLGNLTLTTDQYGHAFFRDADLNAEGSFITVENAAYFTGSRRFFPVDGAETRVRVELIAKQFDHSFASQDGGLVELNGGASITFPENSIRKADGTPYNGTVKLAAHWLDPSNPRTLDRMPGNLQGINNQGTEVVMATYGMVVAELQDEAGNPLNILKGKKATLKMPVPDNLLASAPNEIPLWSYYEEYGVWAEEGKATLQNGAYVGEVSHFSFWNCDYPYPLVNFSATLVDEDGNPVENYPVTISLVSNPITAYGYTDSTGYVGGKVPANEELLIQVYGHCGEVIYSQQIGPYTADIDLGQITISFNALNSTTLSGQLTDCNGDPVTNGIVIMQFNGYNVYEYTTTGDFDVSFTSCSGTIDVSAVDVDQLTQSSPVMVSAGGAFDLGQINICNAPLQNFLRLTYNGATTVYTPVEAGVDAGDTYFFHNMNQDSVRFDFYVTGSTVGNYDAPANFFTNFLNTQIGLYFADAQLENFEITSFGNVGEPIIGTFSGTVNNYWSGTPQPVMVSGDFNVIRNN